MAGDARRRNREDPQEVVLSMSTRYKLIKMQSLIRLIGKAWVRLEVAVGDLIEEYENGETDQSSRT